MWCNVLAMPVFHNITIPMQGNRVVSMDASIPFIILDIYDPTLCSLLSPSDGVVLAGTLWLPSPTTTHLTVFEFLPYR